MSDAQTHILIIDDKPGSLSAVVAALREQAWHISVCTAGRQGFHRAQALLPDLILLDVLMPGMDGFATCRLLKASPRTRDVPIIYLTSVADDAERLEGLGSGAVDYIVKPSLPAEVVARIQIHLRQIRLRQGGQRPGRAAQAEPMPLLSGGEVVVRAAMRLIGDNLAGVPSLDGIARQVGTHDKKLSALFREHVGMTVFAWVREERLRVARDWLAMSEMSIQDIGIQVGFHSAANFSTAFRQRMGVTPSQYRAKLQGGALDGVNGH